MSEKERPFPDRDALQPMSPALADIAASQIVYERQMKDAYAARLRVAVEALKEIRSVHPLMHNGGNWDKFVDEALTLIGPLPELPPLPTGTGES